MLQRSSNHIMCTCISEINAIKLRQPVIITCCLYLHVWMVIIYKTGKNMFSKNTYKHYSLSGKVYPSFKSASAKRWKEIFRHHKTFISIFYILETISKSQDCNTMVWNCHTYKIISCQITIWRKELLGAGMYIMSFG